MKRKVITALLFSTINNNEQKVSAVNLQQKQTQTIQSVLATKLEEQIKTDAALEEQLLASINTDEKVEQNEQLDKKDSKKQKTITKNKKNNQKSVKQTSPPKTKKVAETKKVTKNKEIKLEKKQSDKEMIQQALATITQLPTPEAQEQAAAALAQNMTEDQKKELERQLTSEAEKAQAAISADPVASAAQVEQNKQELAQAAIQEAADAKAQKAQDTKNNLTQQNAIADAVSKLGTDDASSAALLAGAENMTQEQLEQLQKQLALEQSSTPIQESTTQNSFAQTPIIPEITKPVLTPLQAAQSLDLATLQSLLASKMGNPSNSAIQTPPNSSPPAPVAAKVPEKAPLLKTAKPIAVAKKSENKPKQAEKKIEIKPQASEKKVQATKFEGEFLKLDDEDIEDDPKKRLTLTELKLEKETSGMTETEKQTILLRNSIKKIERNLQLAKHAIEKREEHVKELNPLAASQHGLAKSALNDAINKIENRKKELKQYLEEGNKILAEKQINLKQKEQLLVEEKKKKAQESKKKKKKKDKKKSGNDSDSDSSDDSESDDEKDSKSKSLAQMKSDKKEAKETKEKAEKNRADAIAAAVAANTKTWEQKLKDAVSKSEQELALAKTQFQKELNDQKQQLMKEKEETEKKMKDKQQEIEGRLSKETEAKEHAISELQTQKDKFAHQTTSKFVKQMRRFKEQWEHERSTKKRRKIAAAMANATKAWVGQADD